MELQQTWLYLVVVFGVSLNATPVLRPTRITDRPKDNEVPVGSTARFRCSAVFDYSLELKIDWLKDGKPIDFNSEPRFVKSNDNSLTLTSTTELDSGTYTCVASTELDKAEAQATLTVQDVPNAPMLTEVVCKERNSSISWKPMGDNRAPITSFTIQYSTTLKPDVWKAAVESVPASFLTYTVAMSPWANYTFRVLAINKIGPSSPSEHTKVCTTQPDVPYKNPDNVEGKGTDPSNIVISWTPMPEIEHNGPGFRYLVSWKCDIPNESWTNEVISNWHESKLVIPNQPTFKPYRIKVIAINDIGQSNLMPIVVTGYSGEDVPTQSPSNFNLEEVLGPNRALLTWDPVPLDTIRGHFKGYKIQIWSEKEGEAGKKEILVNGSKTRAEISQFVPNTKNYARVLVYNSQYNGPPSETLSFETPEGVPGSVDGLDAIPMGSSALYLVWKKPEQENGILTGYKIYYEEVRGGIVGPLRARAPHVSDANTTHVKLAGLRPETRYRLHVKATTNAGEGEDYFIEQHTNGFTSAPPDVPHFRLELLELQHNHVKVTWVPNLDGRLGSHFYVKYRMKDEPQYSISEHELYEDYLIVGPLNPGQTYEFKLVAVDGEYSTESETQELETEERIVEDVSNSQYGQISETNTETPPSTWSSIDSSGVSSETNKEEPPTTEFPSLPNNGTNTETPPSSIDSLGLRSETNKEEPPTTSPAIDSSL